MPIVRNNNNLNNALKNIRFSCAEVVMREL
jgi:hypothetical protein